MSESEAARLAHQAASRAHVAKNALRSDVGLTNLAAAVERLSQAVAMIAADRGDAETAVGTSAELDEAVIGDPAVIDGAAVLDGAKA